MDDLEYKNKVLAGLTSIQILLNRIVCLLEKEEREGIPKELREIKQDLKSIGIHIGSFENEW